MELANDKFWVNKSLYHDAEKMYFEKKTKDGVGLPKDACMKSALSMEVAKARELIKISMQQADGMSGLGLNDKSSTCNMSSADFSRLTSVIERLENNLKSLEKRVETLEIKCNANIAICPAKPPETKEVNKKKDAADDDDDIDLFGSDSGEESEDAKKIREQRLAEYAAKKSKKPTLIAKSNIILDIKPWNDATDMKKLEEAVRNVKMDGLVWGASKLVPLVFGIYKLQISCVVEDEKVSVDHLTETLEEIEEYIQSIDIAAFNKV